MSIVINEFEIMVEPPDEKTEPAQMPQATAGSSQMPRPEDIVQIQRRYYERKRRLRAD